MTSLDRAEFEALCVVLNETWDRHRQAIGHEVSKGGRPPQLGDIALLEQVLEDASQIKPLIDQNPEWQEIVAHALHLY
jgi:hypothetical protein